MWRAAAAEDDDDIVKMSRELYVEDPAPAPVPEENIRATLSILRKEPVRGRAVVLQVNKALAGYALLISFWSNELGGEVIVIDELFVGPSYRNQGYGRGLIDQVIGERTLWPSSAVAVELEVTPQNQRAAGLYSRLGFEKIKNARLRIYTHSERSDCEALQG